MRIGHALDKYQDLLNDAADVLALPAQDNNEKSFFETGLDGCPPLRHSRGGVGWPTVKRLSYSCEVPLLHIVSSRAVLPSRSSLGLRQPKSPDASILRDFLGQIQFPAYRPLS